MLSYQHIYHAGNFADVHKHVILTHVLKSMVTAKGDISALDTHAGRGVYDLFSEEAHKNQEFNNGIEQVMAMENPPASLKLYLDIVKKYNNEEDRLHYYPGSSAFIRDLLPPSASLISIERHPGEYQKLKKHFDKTLNTSVLQQDGLEYMVDHTPLSRKGLVIIDPSYEIKTDYDDIPRFLINAWRKWPKRTYLIWYPVMSAHRHIHLLSGIYREGITDVLVSEMNLPQSPVHHYHMSGSGMVVINPPWPEHVLNSLTQDITTSMPKGTTHECFWLNNKKMNPDTGLLIL